MDPAPWVSVSAGDLGLLAAGRKPPTAEVTAALGGGRYRVRFEGGALEVKGPLDLRVGDRVRIAPDKKAGASRETGDRASKEPLEGGRLAVLLPLAFGGFGSQLKVSAFIGRKSPGKEGGSPVYFLVETVTEGLGLTQWGIHLTAKRLALQVHAPLRRKGGGPWDDLVGAVAAQLESAGFEWAHPVQFLSKPLRAPAGYGVSVRG